MLVVILSEFLYIMWLIMTYNVFFTLSIVPLFVRPVLSGQPVLSGHPSCTTALYRSNCMKSSYQRVISFIQFKGPTILELRT